jgi:hypothetical protein
MPDGSVRDCVTVRVALSGPAPVAPCQPDFPRSRLSPGYLDAQGEAVARRVVVRMHTEVLPAGEDRR